MLVLENDQKIQKLIRQHRQELDVIQQDLLNCQHDHMKKL